MAEIIEEQIIVAKLPKSTLEYLMDLPAALSIDKIEDDGDHYEFTLKVANMGKMEATGPLFLAYATNEDGITQFSGLAVAQADTEE